MPLENIFKMQYNWAEKNQKFNFSSLEEFNPLEKIKSLYSQALKKQKFNLARGLALQLGQGYIIERIH